MKIHDSCRGGKGYKKEGVKSGVRTYKAHTISAHKGAKDQQRNSKEKLGEYKISRERLKQKASTLHNGGSESDYKSTRTKSKSAPGPETRGGGW